MDYEDIVKEYKSGGLDISVLKQKLEKARPLKARPKPVDSFVVSVRAYRLFTAITNQQVVPEKPEKVERYKKETNEALQQYYLNLIEDVGRDEAWGMMGIVQQNLSQEDFRELSIDEKINLLTDLSQRYERFLQIQKYADFRDFLIGDGDLQDENIQKMQFILKMFNSLETPEERKHFFCFSMSFISTLMGFKKSKCRRIEEYFQTKRRRTQFSYKNLAQFFKEEEFRDIISNLDITSRALKVSPKEVASYYIKISELMNEIDCLQDNQQLLQELKKKNQTMLEVERQGKKEKEEAEQRAKEAEERKRQEEKKKQIVEPEKKVLELRKTILSEKEGSTGKDEEEREQIEKTVTVKENVIPILFIWADREGESLSKYATAKQLNAFFDRIKNLEEKYHARAALYMITRADEETTLARIRDIKNRAEAKGLKRFFDGALGGYGAFRVSADGTVTPLVKMSDKTRNDVKELISISSQAGFPEEWIDPREKNYIRYFFTLKKDKSIDEKYLKYMAIRAMRDPVIKKQPLEFNIFEEGGASGIDVMLKEQAEIIKRIPAYIRSRYLIVPGAAINIRAEEIKEFVKEDEKGEEK